MFHPLDPLHMPLLGLALSIVSFAGDATLIDTENK
jgi:hypothetical protein